MGVIVKVKDDYLAGYMRAQVHRLRRLLEKLESEEVVDTDYLSMHLRQIEHNLRSLRKEFLSN